MKKYLLLFLSCFTIAHARAQIITTIAGDNTEGYSGDGGPAINAQLYAPYDVALDGSGNYYIADGYNDRIRKVNASGIITTIAGTGVQGYNGDGIPGDSAELYRPVGIACDHSGNIFFADAYNHRVRRIDRVTGIITTVAGTGVAGYNGDNIAATAAEIYDPHGLTIDAEGSLYITDFGNFRIRKVNSDGVITTIAGTGVSGYSGDGGLAVNAEMDGPYGIASDNLGDIYFTDIYNNVLRKIDNAGFITTIAGQGSTSAIGDNGPADSCRFSAPGGLCIDLSRNFYIADVGNERIRKISAATNIITTVAGNGIHGHSGDGGVATAAELLNPTGVAIDNSGNLYIADFNNDKIRFVTSTETVNTLSPESEEFKIYPNPSNGSFSVKVTSSVKEEVNICITDVLGNTITRTVIADNAPVVIKLNTAPGEYFLSGYTAQKTFFQKIIVE